MIRIKDWSRFQHYQSGKRNPDWIKLYRGLLDDVDWHNLDPQASKVLVMLWLLASENGGVLPSIKKIAFRLRMTEKQVNTMLSKLDHWLEQDASDALAERYQSDSPEEEEKKKEKRGASAPLAILKTVLDEERAKAVIEHRKKKRSPLTDRAAELLAKEFFKAPDPNAAADTMIAAGWQGFEVGWLENRKGKTKPQSYSAPLQFKPEPEIVKATVEEREANLAKLRPFLKANRV